MRRDKKFYCLELYPGNAFSRRKHDATYLEGISGTVAAMQGLFRKLVPGFRCPYSDIGEIRNTAFSITILQNYMRGTLNPSKNV